MPRANKCREMGVFQTDRLGRRGQRREFVEIVAIGQKQLPTVTRLYLTGMRTFTP